MTVAGQSVHPMLSAHRRGLDSHLFHQQANWNSAQIGQLEQCCTTIGISALEFMCQLQQVTLLLGHDRRRADMRIKT